jgi:hypothetical protein
LLADTHVKEWPKSEHGQLRAAIQQTLQGNSRDERLDEVRKRPADRNA